MGRLTSLLYASPLYRFTLNRGPGAKLLGAPPGLLATGLLVLGPEEGYELALREDFAVLFMSRDGEGFSERMTPAFEALTRGAP